MDANPSRSKFDLGFDQTLGGHMAYQLVATGLRYAVDLGVTTSQVPAASVAQRVQLQATAQFFCGYNPALWQGNNFLA